jgi:hypothetical protein
MNIIGRKPVAFMQKAPDHPPMKNHRKEACGFHAQIKKMRIPWQLQAAHQ